MGASSFVFEAIMPDLALRHKVDSPRVFWPTSTQAVQTTKRRFLCLSRGMGISSSADQPFRFIVTAQSSRTIRRPQNL
jgi:hypothetical protein